MYLLLRKNQLKKLNFIILFLSFLSFNSIAQNNSSTVQNLKLEFQSVEKKIDSILLLLTLEEKIAMCHAQSKFTSPGIPRLGIPVKCSST